MSTLEAKLLIGISNVSSTNDITVTRSAVSLSGDVYVTGYLNTKLNPDSLDLESNGFIAKYDRNLTPISLNGMNGTEPSHTSGGASIAISLSDEVYVTGGFGGTLNIGGTVPSIISSTVNGFIAKYNRDLTL